MIKKHAKHNTEKNEKDDVIVIEEKKKPDEDFDLGREDLDTGQDDDLDMEDDFDYDDGGSD